MSELKACPFCGEKPTCDKTGPANHYIVCLKCSLSFGPYVCGEHAESIWNRRPPSDEARLREAAQMEVLAAIEHERWSGWMRYLFSKCDMGYDSNEEGDGKDNGTMVIPMWAVERWKRQMNTPYAALSESEKESDRVEVRKTLAALSTHPAAPSVKENTDE